MSDADLSAEQPTSLPENSSVPDHGAALAEVVSQTVAAIEKMEPLFQAAQAAINIDQKALDVVAAAKAAAQNPEVAKVYDLAVAQAKKNLQGDVNNGTAVQTNIAEKQAALAQSLVELKKVKPESPLAALAEAA